MDEKSTHFAVHFSPPIFGNFKIYIFHYTQHSFKNSVGFFILFYSHVDGEMCTSILSFFWFGSNPNIYIYIFVELSFFCFILVHTQVRRVRNYYIIIYNMKNHHFKWMSFLNCLIGAFFKVTITYNDST